MRSGPWQYRKAPRVTVAMVTFNSGRFVREAIESVLAQDIDDFELVICDDCSTDDTWAIIRSFQDRRIRALRSETNLGEYRNRNRALALARGKYVMYLDGDDLLYPHGLRVMLAGMERFPQAAFGGCLPPADKFVFPVKLTPKEYCSCTFFGPIVLASNFTQLVFRTDALKSIGGFDLRYRTGDLHIQYALGSRHEVVLLGSGLAWWRRHAGQASEALIASGDAVVELWKYCRELLDESHCPLTPQEKALALENLNRMLLRNTVKMLLRPRPMNALRMVLATRIPWSDWSCLFTPYRKPYLGSVTGANPVRSLLEIPKPAVLPPRPVLARHPPAIADRRRLARALEVAK